MRRVLGPTVTQELQSKDGVSRSSRQRLLSS
jgi:hypothetical protein